VDHGRVAEIEVVLEGIDLPASKEQLIAYAAREDAAAAHALQALPEGDYDYLDQVGEMLLRTQPSDRADKLPPKPESGSPPGGEDYTKPFPEPGHVRPSIPPGNPPQKVIDRASQTQKRQQAVQEGKAEKAG
jgi:hypothetical protein